MLAHRFTQSSMPLPLAVWWLKWHHVNNRFVRRFTYLITLVLNKWTKQVYFKVSTYMWYLYTHMQNFICYMYFRCWALFSSPTLKVQVSLSDRPISVWRLCPFNRLLHFLFLLQNCWANSDQSWHKSSLGEGNSKLFISRETPFSGGGGDNSERVK
jgi:hypothetical protein